MHSFTDSQDRIWQLEINVSAVKRVKALTGVDLVAGMDGELLEQLALNPVLLADLLYALCQPQADEAQVSDEDFGRGLAGDVIDAATEAFLQELVDFFPKRQRGVLGQVLAKSRELQDKTAAAASKMLASDVLDRGMEQILTNHEALMQRKLEALLSGETSGGTSTDSPEPSASTPAR